MRNVAVDESRTGTTSSRTPGVGLLLGVALGVLAGIGGCQSPASDAQCRKACDNVAEIGRGEVDRRIGESEAFADAGDDAREMARSMSAEMVDAIRDECLEQCKSKATARTARCLAEAGSLKAIRDCE